MKARISRAIEEYKSDIVPVALILFLPLVVNWNVFFALGPLPKIYPFGNDFAQTYNILALSVQSLLAGELGLWVPNWGFGTPYFAHPLSSILYPFTILLSKFSDLQHILPFGTFIIYLFMAKGVTGCLFYFLMRELKINRWGALVGAIVWGFNLRVEDIIRTQGAAHSIMWLPLLVLLSLRLLQKPCRRYIAYFALAFALSYLASYPVNFVYSMGFITLIFAFTLLENYPDLDRKKYAVGLSALCAAIALGTCLVAIQLLPGLEFISHYNRKGGFTFDETMIYTCTPLQIVLGYIFPSAACTERDHYAGLLPLILASVGILAHDTRYKYKKLLVFTIIMTALYSTNSAISLPLQKFFYNYVPLFRGFRCPGRSLILNMFCLAVLSGYGMDCVAGRRPISNNVKILTKTAVGTLLAICVIALLFPGIDTYLDSQLDRYDYISWAAVSSLSLVILLSNVKNTSRNRVFPFLAVAILIANLSHSTFRKSVGPRKGFVYYLQTDPRIKDARSLITNSLNEKYYHIPAPASERLGRIDSQAIQPFLFVSTALPGYGPPFDVNSYDGSLLDTTHFFIRTRENRLVRSLLNTRFGVQYFLPRQFVVYHLKKLPRDEIIEGMLSPEFDPLNTHYVEEDLPGEFAALRSDGKEVAVNETDRLLQIKDEARMIEFNNDFMKVSVDIPRPGFLFSSDVFFPGWKAYVDEKPAKIYRTNYLFQGVPVPAGKHTITFFYRPRALFLGLGLSVAALLILLGMLVSDGRYRETIALAIILFLCYAPLALPGDLKRTHDPLETITPYNVQGTPGIEQKASFETPVFVEKIVHMEEDGIYDLLVEFPPQAYQLFVDDEFVARIFNTASESPPPEKGLWDVQAILTLKKGDHRFRFMQLIPQPSMKPVYSKIVFKPGTRDRFEIVPIRINTSMHVRRIKLVRH